MRVLLVLLLAACAPSVDRSERPIVNGTVDTGDPATVFLWLGGGSCSGTLISPHVVLTARHCLEGVSLSQLEVFFGTEANGPGTWIRAVDYEYHASGDIGVVAMQEPGPTAPIPVNARDLSAYVGQPVRIVGFGQTSEYGGGSGVKRQGTTVLDSVEGDIMYTGYVDESWTCYGDSGGPNFMTIDGVEHVVGATSFGTTVCGQPADGSVRTDTYHAWIMAFVEAYDPAPPSPPDAGVPDAEVVVEGDPDAAAGDDFPVEPEPEAEATGDLVGGCAAGGSAAGGAWLLGAALAILYIWRRLRVRHAS